MTDETRLWDHAAEAPENWDAAHDALAAEAVRVGAARSAEIRRRLENAALSADDVTTLAELGNVPILAKDELPELQSADPPFAGMLGVAPSELRRIYQSPGPINDPEGRGADFWRMAPALWAAGFRPGELVLNTFSYHLTPGGHMMDAGLREVGCVVLPGGVGNTSTQVAYAASSGATGYVGTPQFLLVLLERAREDGARLAFEKALVTGAPLPPDLRAKLQDEFGVGVCQAYGTADAGTLAYECAARQGWHVAPGVAIELIDPGTGERAAGGEPGQVVVTSPNPVYPLLRFGTGDLSALDRDACVCGRTSPRLVGFLGRVGEGVKVRGMFVHPRQLASVLADRSEVACYQGVVTANGHQDHLTVSIESSDGDELDVAAIEALLIEATRLRVTVEAVVSGTLDPEAPPLVDGRRSGGC
ncbi:MAG: AMP-binding protein [Gemmatimonadetes bacterium]|nr:AMP-binding protein [Gemmatimonadota bacterium]